MASTKFLDPPPAASRDKASFELLRVWVAEQGQHVSLRSGAWEDPFAWGIVLADLARQNIGVVFARVSSYLRSDMDRHCITPAIGEARIFTTLHEALAAVHSGVLREKVEL